jgi:hypothetical protein
VVALLAFFFAGELGLGKGGRITVCLSSVSRRRLNHGSACALFVLHMMGGVGAHANPMNLCHRCTVLAFSHVSCTVRFSKFHLKCGCCMIWFQTGIAVGFFPSGVRDDRGRPRAGYVPRLRQGTFRGQVGLLRHRRPERGSQDR